MRQTRIRVTCDACQAWKGREVEEGVETVPVSHGQTLDLCPDHREGMRAVLALIAEWGAAPVKGSKRNAASTPVATSVPVAPTNGGNLPSKRGGARARQRRSAAPAGTVAVNVLACPLCSAQRRDTDSMSRHLKNDHGLVPGAVYGGTCPVCNHAGSPQGLGTHANQAHGIRGVATLFAQAQADGDPHGVVASRAHTLAQQMSS